MSDTGRWTQEGIAKLRDAIRDGETVKMTHFALSGSANLGTLTDFTVSDGMVMGTFPRQIYTGPVLYSFINDDGFLQVHTEVAADVEAEFYCNGIGLIFTDVMGRKFLMAIGAVPLQQHARLVNNNFEFILPIVNDVADLIEVTMEPGDRVSQAQLSAAVGAHSGSIDAHSDHRNATGAALAFAVDAAGLAHKELTRIEKADVAYRKGNDALHADNDSYHASLSTVLLGAVESVALAHREHNKTVSQRIQSGTVTITSRGVISGLAVTKSIDATRNLNMAGGAAFTGGTVVPVVEQKNGASVPGNAGTESAVYHVYLSADREMICVPPGDAPDGILLYAVTVPAGNTEATDPHLSNVTLTDMRRLEPLFPAVMSSCPVHFVGFQYAYDATSYVLDLVIESYTGSPFGVGGVEVLSRAKNGFSVQHTGIVDNVRVRWSARKLDL